MQVKTYGFIVKIISAPNPPYCTDTVLQTSNGDWIAVFQDTTFSPLYSFDFIGLG
ncbi:MAG: hypothetical protein QNJ47_21030 [Nostocaceae cyanobacterium]|nr:hypothetical protein [Nostocaceae cyanobacterium]